METLTSFFPTADDLLASAAHLATNTSRHQNATMRRD
jgi:hypothetical protein